MAEDKDPREATKFAETLHRHEGDPSQWEEADVKTDRTNDTPLRGEDAPAVPNSTLAERAKSVKQVDKASDNVEDKKVTRARKKSAG
jgi:hypothetical protein